MNHKFHYDSVKQTAQWLALHRAYSPSRTDPDCAATYEAAFKEAASRFHGTRAHVIGLGCGGGQKDAGLLGLLRSSARELFYTPLDVSTAMVLEARRTVLAGLPSVRCLPLVCDLSQARDLPTVLEEHFPEAARSGAARWFTFFGMIPNFEPEMILPRLAELIQPADCLLFSANLAPGPDYAEGIKRVLPLYDNELTRAWLETFLLDAGLERQDGRIHFGIEASPKYPNLKRITARFQFTRPRRFQVEDECFSFLPGEEIRLFFSYRHTPGLLQSLFREHGLEARQTWVTRSGEEGVFLVGRSRI